MAPMRRTLLAGLALAALLLALPAASAHATVLTDDEAYYLTVGNLNEPTTTFMNTGLDLIVRVNDDGEPGEEVPDLHQTLTATIVAPDGTEKSMDLRTQHGAVGRYSFAEPYYLTQPGQYHLRLVGNIGDTQVDDVYRISEEVPDIRDAWFPDQDVPTLADLQQQVADLEGQVADLESRLAALETGTPDQEGRQSAPGPAAALLVLVLLCVAFLVRRRV